VLNLKTEKINEQRVRNNQHLKIAMGQPAANKSFKTAVQGTARTITRALCLRVIAV